MSRFTLEQRWEILKTYFQSECYLAQTVLFLKISLGRKIIFSDEAHFYLGGYANKENCRGWGLENPLVTAEKPMHPQRVTVWCGLSLDKQLRSQLMQPLERNCIP